MNGLDTRVILAGQPVDVMNALQQGTQTAGMQNRVMRQNALAQLYRDQGPGIMAGEQGALDALATMDPTAALGVQNTRLGMDATRQSMRINEENLQIARQNARTAAAEAALQLSAEQRETATARLEGLQAALMSVETPQDFAGLLDRTQAMFPDLDLSGVTFENRMQYLPVLEGMIDGVRVQSMAPIPGGDGTEADREIARLMQIGVPYDTAVKIKEGVYRTVTDPETKETLIIDLATQQPVGVIQAGGEATAPPGQDTAGAGSRFGEPYSGAGDAFGVEGFLRRGLNAASDVVGADPLFPETLQTQADFDLLRENLINDVASAYARQPPAFLLREIRALTPRAGSLAMGPEGAQTKLRALGRQFESELGSANAALRRRLSPTDRAKLQARAQGLQAAIDKIDAALAGFEPDSNLTDDDRALIDKYSRAE